MLNEENLKKIDELIARFETANNQDEINKIGDEYIPIAQFYQKESVIAKGTKSIQTFWLSDTQNTFGHLNFNEPLIHIKNTLQNNLNILRMHIISLCEKNNEIITKPKSYNSTTYNIYGDNAIVNNGTIYSDAINKINSFNLSDDDKEEITNQIELIQTILDSKDSKEKKWSKLKNIGKWLFDKSVDVGIAILPLLMNIK